MTGRADCKPVGPRDDTAFQDEGVANRDTERPGDVIVAAARVLERRREMLGLSPGEIGRKRQCLDLVSDIGVAQAIISVAAASTLLSYRRFVPKPF
jgi:hypothetical protein